MPNALSRLGIDHEIIDSASSLPLRRYLVELTVYLKGIVPDAEIHRLLEETSDHFETLLEEGEFSFEEATVEFGKPRQLADAFIEAWYAKRASKSFLERRLGPGNMVVLSSFGLAALAYWILLQFRVFLPSDSAFHLPWSPGQIRRFFPEPLPFPDFSVQFLLLTGIPILAPPILGWMVGRVVHVRPHMTTYSVMVLLTIVSFFVGISLLPVTDGLVFAIFQTVYWLPVGCGCAYWSCKNGRKNRARIAQKLILQGVGDLGVVEVNP